jgi:hypothetical protein
MFPLTLPAEEPIQKISKWAPGKRIQVICTNGDKLLGRLGRVTSGGFTLNPDRKGAGSPREIGFTEVRSVKSKWTTGEKWLVAGLIYAGVTTVFAVTLGK